MLELFRRFYFFINRRRLDQELANDMAVHREMLGAEARTTFGNATVLREQSHEAWGWGWLERFMQDVRYGFRMLRNNPGFTLVAILALGLGIGANTALFSMVYGILIKPLPYAQGHQLMVLTQLIGKTSDGMGFSAKDIKATANRRGPSPCWRSITGWGSFFWMARNQPAFVPALSRRISLTCWESSLISAASSMTPMRQKNPTRFWF